MLTTAAAAARHQKVVIDRNRRAVHFMPNECGDTCHSAPAQLTNTPRSVDKHAPL
eukprot:COSAG01_NODE_28228_length_666_cov_0.895944_1_plen_54_part_10